MGTAMGATPWGQDPSPAFPQHRQGPRVSVLCQPLLHRTPGGQMGVGGGVPGSEEQLSLWQGEGPVWAPRGRQWSRKGSAYHVQTPKGLSPDSMESWPGGLPMGEREVISGTSCEDPPSPAVVLVVRSGPRKTWQSQAVHRALAWVRVSQVPSSTASGWASHLTLCASVFPSVN